MTWFKVCDTLYDHPKVETLSDEALGFWTRCGSYASRHLTDGFISDSVGARLARNSRRFRALRDTLVKAGLFSVRPGGVQFHDWQDYQPSRVEVLSESERKRESGRRGGQASARARAVAAAAPSALPIVEPVLPESAAPPIPIPIPSRSQREKEEIRDLLEPSEPKTGTRPRQPRQQSLLGGQEADPPPGHRDVLAAYVEAYTGARKVAPQVGGHEARVASELIGKFGAEESIAIIRRALQDPWTVANQPMLRSIATNADRYRGEVATPRAKYGHLPQAGKPPASYVAGKEDYMIDTNYAEKPNGTG